jgi:hypothetical protein
LKEKITPEPIKKKERPEVMLKMPESLSLDDLIPIGGAVVTKIGKTNIVMTNDGGILKIYTPVENSIVEVEIAKTLDDIIKRVDNWMKLEKAIESSARTYEFMGREKARERIKNEESRKRENRQKEVKNAESK